MQHDIITKCSSNYQKDKKYYLLGIRREQISFFTPIFRNIFFLIVTVIITQKFNIHFSKITWLVTMWSFLLGCVPNFINAPLLYCWHWVKSFPTAALFHNSENIFWTFDNKGAMEIDLKREHKNFLKTVNLLMW